MARIIDIQKKSAQWMANFDANVVKAIEANPKNVEANRVQMFNSTDADDKSLIHKLTGSTNLTKAYAKRSHKTKPNLFLTGAFQKAMFIFMPNSKEYFMSSKDQKAGYLTKNYGKIFGISPTNQPKVKESNNALIINDYLKNVLR